MTNREMVKPAAGEAEVSQTVQRPNEARLPPMPADGDSRTPTTGVEPADSPQPNFSPERRPPAKGEIGLSTKR